MHSAHTDRAHLLTQRHIRIRHSYAGSAYWPGCTDVMDAMETAGSLEFFEALDTKTHSNIHDLGGSFDCPVDLVKLNEAFDGVGYTGWTQSFGPCM